ncbi:Uncharacterised protein [Segatella copri]|nr:Uncharacterised protein [Segatella copri]
MKKVAISTVNIIGFFTISRGFSLTKDCLRLAFSWSF